MYTRHWITLGLVLALSLPTAANAGQPEGKAMASQIANTIRDSGKLSNFRIGVRFEDGQAVLLGEVTDRSQAEAAIRVAEQIAGVDSVVSRLSFTDPKPTGKALNALHVENSQPELASTPGEESGMLLSLEPQGPEIIQTQSVRKASKRAVAERGASKPQPKQTAQPKRMAQPKRVASQPKAPRPMTAARPAAPQRVARVSNTPRSNMPRPVAFTGNGQRMPRPVQPVGYGGPAGPRPAGYHPGGGGATGVGYDNPNMPGYAWPSYAAPQNYSALTYPKQYSPTAWPYIGPFYPYPQVPLGWRKVALEWDDGWWFLDFSHHQSH